MNIDYAKSFDQQIMKLPGSKKQLARDTIELFIDDPSNEDLRNHPLKDKWSGYRSITVDDDLRLHYKELKNNRSLFVAVGSHDELYK